MVKVKTKVGEAIYGSRERVGAGDGVRFEVYLREEQVLKGIFRREEAQKWKIECKYALERGDGETVGGERAVAVVFVEVGGDVAMGERVEMSVRKRKKNRRVGFDQLEEIPEEREGIVNRTVDVAAVVGNQTVVVWKEGVTEIVVGGRRWIQTRRK